MRMGKWLSSVLSAYRTTPQRSTGENPFALAYGMEVVIPLEIGLPTMKTEAYNHEQNKERLAKHLDMIKKMKGAITDRVSCLPATTSSKLPEESARASFQGQRSGLEESIPEYEGSQSW